jgi:branched-chain amino acid transport system ATP-binding protein
MNAIELDGVTAGYEVVPGIHDLRLRVGAGEVVALLGANGAGKSTTVRAICGLVAIHSGSVQLLGEDVIAEPTHRRARRGLAAVIDDRALFTQLTVAENLRLGSRRDRHAPASGRWFPELDPLLDRQAGLLSGGEQQLLALARALASRPAALVVDELTAGLAPALAVSVLSILRRAAKEWGTGVLLAEQSAELALEFADRACVLRRGRIVIEGRAGDVASRRDVLEATYFGEARPG